MRIVIVNVERLIDLHDGHMRDVQAFF